MLTDYFLRPFEMLLNRGLTQSTTAEALARALEGRTLALAVDDTPVDIRMTISDGRIRLAVPGAVAAGADAAISGSALGLSRLLGDDPQAAIRDGAVKMSGDTDVADQFRILLRHARPDLEEELSRVLGDPVAHLLGNAARGVSGWAAAAAATVNRSISEYLQEESRILPTRIEVADFSRQVDELVNDVARAEARFQRMKDGAGGFNRDSAAKNRG